MQFATKYLSLFCNHRFVANDNIFKLFGENSIANKLSEFVDKFAILSRLGHITKTCLYNFDPLKPQFYIVKLGFTGVYIIFLISAQKHRLWVLVRTASACGYSLEPPRRGGSNEYPQSMF